MITANTKIWEEELACCRQAITKAAAGEDKFQICLALANLGFVLFQSGAYEEGLTQFEASDALAVETGDLTLRTQCLGIKALAYQDIDRGPDAYQVADTIFNLGKQHNNVGIMVDALVSQGQILIDSGDPDLASQRLDQAQTILGDHDDPRRHMNLSGVLGHLHLLTADIKSAQTCFDAALNLASDLHDEQAEAGFLTNLGIISAKFCDPVQTASMFERVLILTHKLGEPQGELNALQYLINVYMESDPQGKLIRYLARALELAGELADDQALPHLEGLLIHRLLENRQFEDAVSAINAALEKPYAQIDEAIQLGLVVKLGDAYNELGHTAQATKHYETALMRAEELNLFPTVAHVLGRLGTIYANQGDLNRATSVTDRALILARSLNDDEMVGELLCLSAFNYRDSNRIPEAIGCCQEAIETYTRTGTDLMTQRAQSFLDELETQARTLAG